MSEIDVGSQIVHIVFVTAAATMALWTLYLDLKYFYGWQGGAWLLKFTHWSFMVTLGFLAVSLLDALTFGFLFGSLRRGLLYLALVLALSVDIGFFAVIFPRRVLGKDTNFSGSPLSPSSAHKHLINLLWILGEAVSHPASSRRVPFTERHKIPELLMFGLFIPIFISGCYYNIARTIKDEEKGKHFLQTVGIPLPGDFSEFDPTDAETRGNCTAIPGHWIYSSFKHKKLRTLFLLSPAVYLPVSIGVLATVEAIVANHKGFVTVLLALTLTVTPMLYLPGVWEREHQSIKAIVFQMQEDFVLAFEQLQDSQKVFRKRLARFSNDFPSLAKSFMEGMVGTLNMAIRDTIEGAKELAQRLESKSKNRSSKRISSKRMSSKRSSRRASRDSLAQLTVPATAETDGLNFD